MKKQALAAVLCVGLAASMLSGCNNSGDTNTASEELIPEVTTTDTYPIETDAEISYWVALNANVAAYAGSMNDTEMAKYLQEETGINVKFTHPATGQEKEKFNLMVASRDLTDIVETDWYNYTGGPDKAITDKVIYPLDEALEKVSPNFKAYLAENPDVAGQVQTDSGQYYIYPFVTKADKLRTCVGFMIRQDLLDEAGLEIPETIDEWETVLLKFKELGVKTPISMQFKNSNMDTMSNFMGAFGIQSGWYVENDTVKFGQYEEAYRDYLTTMARWYEEGLIDSGFADEDSKRISAMVISGDVGAVSGWNGSGFGSWIPGLEAAVDGATLVPVPYVAQNKGETPFTGHIMSVVGGSGAAITTSCKNVEVAARLLDYGFSEAGHMMYNFGREGVSYEMVDNVPTYTDIILDTEKNGGLSVSQAMSKYIRACYNGPFEQDPDYLFQMYPLEVQKEAVEVWSQTDAKIHKLPLTIMTEEENKEFSEIMSDINTFREEKLAKIVSGQESVDTIDSYYETLKGLNMERAIELQQAAYDRYLARQQ